MLGDGLMMFSHVSRCFRMFLFSFFFDVYMRLKCFVDVRIDFHRNFKLFLNPIPQRAFCEGQNANRCPKA